MNTNYENNMYIFFKTHFTTPKIIEYFLTELYK